MIQRIQGFTLAIALLAIVACGSPAPSPAHNPIVEKLESANAKREGVVSASAQVIQDTAALTPESPERLIIVGEAELILASVMPATAAQLASARARAEKAWVDAKAYAAAISAANDDIRALRAEITALEAAKTQAEALARAQAAAKIEAAAAAAKAERDWMVVAGLVGIGGLLLLIGGIGAPVLAWLHQNTAPALLLIGIGICISSSAAVVDETWFKWAIGAEIIAAVAALFFVVRQAMRPAAVMRDLTPAIDEWVSENIKDFPDLVNSLLDKFSKRMDKVEKSTVAAMRKRITVKSNS